MFLNDCKHRVLKTLKGLTLTFLKCNSVKATEVARAVAR